MIILGIESSCDETAIAIIDAEKRHCLAHQIASQIAKHRPYGGVVPEIAARDHFTQIDQLLDKSLAEADCDLSQIDLIAVTSGPGLIGSLLVGVSFAKALAVGLNKPIIEVNHLVGHALINRFNDAKLAYPFYLLLASGGHSLLALVEQANQFSLLGQSQDDAFGEQARARRNCLCLPTSRG